MDDLRDVPEGEPVYLRDLDGTGSMHVCSQEDPGAVMYVPAPMSVAEAARVPDWTHDIPWDAERGELILEVSHTLTEPTCPTVILKWETSGKILCRFDNDTIEEGVDAAIAWARENITFEKRALASSEGE